MSSVPLADAVRPTRAAFQLRAARPTDGREVHRLVQEVGGLERNTGYAYLLLCDHFAETTLVAESGGRIAGFVAAFHPPRDPESLFVWQVGVHPSARGAGLASALLDALVDGHLSRGTRYLEATVTPSNLASRRLFESFAARRGAPHRWLEGYPASLLETGHEPEALIRVGPFASPSSHPENRD